MKNISFPIVNVLASAIAIASIIIFLFIWQASSIIFNLEGVQKEIESRLTKEFPGAKVSIEKINLAFHNFSKKNKILEITKEKLVSIDFNHNQASSIIDSSLTNVIGKNMGKISAWYDNEWGFSNRMCDIAEYVHKNS